jgi:hypothetical protein
MRTNSLSLLSAVAFKHTHTQSNIKRILNFKSLSMSWSNQQNAYQQHVGIIFRHTFHFRKKLGYKNSAQRLFFTQECITIQTVRWLDVTVADTKRDKTALWKRLKTLAQLPPKATRKNSFPFTPNRPSRSPTESTDSMWRVQTNQGIGFFCNTSPQNENRLRCAVTEVLGLCGSKFIWLATALTAKKTTATTELPISTLTLHNNTKQQCLHILVRIHYHKAHVYTFSLSI